MKLVVDKLPEEPKDCPFSLYEPKVGMYVCQLRPYREEADAKPKCLCKSTDRCDQLIEITSYKKGI